MVLTTFMEVFSNVRGEFCLAGIQITPDSFRIASFDVHSPHLSTYML